MCERDCGDRIRRKHRRIDTGDAKNTMNLAGIRHCGRLLVGRPAMAEANSKLAGSIACNGNLSREATGENDVERERIGGDARHDGAPRPAALPLAKHA